MAVVYGTDVQYDKCSKDFPDSSNVVRAEYQLGPNPHLTITYKKAGAYRYDDVPVEIWMGLIEADSPGKYVHAHIRERFPTTKVESPT